MAWSNYKDLLVWKKSIDLVKEVYSLVKCFPKEETYALSDQLRRSVVSIPSNIAEGNGRQSKNEFKQFLSIAKGSAYEVETQLVIAVQLHFLTQKQAEKAFSLCDEISKMITGLMLSIDKQSQRSTLNTQN